MRSTLLFPRINRHTRVLPTHLGTAPVNADPVVRCVPPASSLVEFGAYIGGEKVDANGIPEAVRMVREHNEANEVPGAYVWVGLHEPAAPEVEWLAEVFGLHPLAVEDAIKAHQRPKVERYGDSLFMVLKTVAFLDGVVPTASGEIIGTGEIMVFVGPDFVVTVRHGRYCPLGDVREKLESKAKLISRGPAGVLHAIADHVVDKYLQVADLMQAELEEVEAAVFAEVSSRDINRIYQLKREMLELKRAVGPLQTPSTPFPSGAASRRRCANTSATSATTSPGCASRCRRPTSCRTRFCRPRWRARTRLLTRTCARSRPGSRSSRCPR